MAFLNCPYASSGPYFRVHADALHASCADPHDSSRDACVPSLRGQNVHALRDSFGDVHAASGRGSF